MSDEPAVNPLPNPPAGAFTVSAPSMPSVKQDQPALDTAGQEAAQQAATLKRLAALRQARVYRMLELAMVPLVLALAFMLGSFAVHNSDYWMHLATGRLLAHGEYAFGHDPFAFGTEGRYWVNHSWLYDWLVYQIWKIDATGAAAVAFKAIVLMVMAGFMLLACQPEPHARIPLGSRANPTGWLAALLVAVALVAAAPRFLLQPTVFSFLFVAITFWLLMRSAIRPASWRLPASLGVLFALWVNLDVWFVLGPALVALFLLGELLQMVLPGEAPGQWSRVKILSLSLFVGLLACCLNPHTWHALTLPADLYAPQLAESFRTDESFRYQFISPLDHRFYASEKFGKSFSGWFYFGLLALGVLSFAINFGRLRWSLVLSWLALAAMSSLNSRAIPFFAIVAVPIAVWNLHAAVARWGARADNVPASEQLPAPSSAVGGVSVTPEAVMSFLGLMGRLLTIVLGVAALVLAWPGWLTPDAPAWQDRRVAWRAEPDQAQKLVAEQIERWREQGRLPDSVHGFQSYPDLVNYAAWFAPKEKGFFDYRYSFLGDRSADFIDVRRALKDVAFEGKADNHILAEVFRKYAIRYIVVDRHDAALTAVLLQYMYLHPEEWSIWYMNGEVIVGGWQDKQAPGRPPESPDDLSGLKEDFVHAAFGPQTERISPPTPGRLQLDPDSPIPARTSWDNFLSNPAPVPLESAAANQYLLLYNAGLNVGMNRLLAVNDMTQLASDVALHATPDWRALLVTLPIEAAWARGRSLDMVQAQVWYHEDAVPAFVILTVRAARQAIALHPDDPVAYFSLARAYGDFFAKGSQIQIMGKIVALRQGMARLTPELLKDVWIVGQAHAAYPQLVQLYSSTGHFDLALECMQKSIDLLKRSPPPNRSTEELEQMLKARQQQVQQFEKELSARSDRYELDARNQSASNRFTLAKAYGLTKEAMHVLEAEANAERLKPADALRLAQTYVELGQVEQAWQALAQIEEKVGVEQLDPPSQAFYRLLRINIAAVRGDFPEAIKDVDRFITEQERIGDQLQWTGKIVSAIGARYLYDLIYQNALARIPYLVESNQLLMAALRYFEQTGSGYYLRAMLALEYGDNEKARTDFALAIGQGAPFEGRREAQRYLELLQKELPASAPNRRANARP
jgi:tetratricopeptide (TPR) repeat protein